MPPAGVADSHCSHFCPSLEWNGFAVGDLLHGDEGHLREHLGVLEFFAKLFVTAKLRQDESLLSSSCLQVVCAPLQDGIIDGFGALAAPQEIQSPPVQLGIKV